MQRFMDVVREAGDLHQSGEFERAAYLYENLLGAVPDDPIVMYLYGTLCNQTGRYGTGIVLLRAALDLNPGIAEAWHNLGVAYRNEGHVDQARQAYRKSIELQPNNPASLTMMAGSYVNAGNPAEGLIWADKALAQDPNEVHAKNQKALCLLELGRLKEGWALYENRFELMKQQVTRRDYPAGEGLVPKWDGKKVGKLVIHGEQGIGDEIMFLSAFEDARPLADEIVIEACPRLKALFKRSFGCRVYGTHDELLAKEKDIDAFIPMGSLPALFREKPEDFPRDTYLKVNSRRVKHWRKRLEKLGPGPYYGLAWHGGTKETHQEVRNAPIEMWKALIENTPGTFVSLQYGDHGPDQAEYLGIPHWRKGVGDLDEFAAITKALDGVVTVLQTALHFAGAIGTPCVVLCSEWHAWPFHGEGKDMMWYGDHLQLIRQRDNDWVPVFEEARNVLSHL